MIRHILAAAVAALTAVPILPAHAADRPADKIAFALDWTPNTNHVGVYVAKALGYYDKAGLDVQILPYTDSSPGTLMANGVAQMGIIGSLAFYSQNASGVPLMPLYAVTQHETGRLVFDGDRKDIQRPRDLDGMTYGGFGTNWESALISTIIRADGGKGDFKTVTLGTSAYDALASGRVDFTLEIVTWEGVNADLLGRSQRAFAYADYGVPDQYTTMIGGMAPWIKAHPAETRAFIAATEKGYAYAAAHPEKASEILMKATKGMLSNDSLIRASMQALVKGHYLVDSDGTIGRMDPARIKAMGDFLFDHQILTDADGKTLTARPDFTSWFSNAYLPETE